MFSSITNPHFLQITSFFVTRTFSEPHSGHFILVFKLRKNLSFFTFQIIVSKIIILLSSKESFK